MFHRESENSTRRGGRRALNARFAPASALVCLGLIGGCVSTTYFGAGAVGEEGAHTQASSGAALVFDSAAVRAERRSPDLTHPEYGRRDGALGVREPVIDRSPDDGRTVIDRRRRSLNEPYREVRRGHVTPRSLYRRDFR